MLTTLVLHAHTHKEIRRPRYREHMSLQTVTGYSAMQNNTHTQRAYRQRHNHPTHTKHTQRSDTHQNAHSQHKDTKHLSATHAHIVHMEKERVVYKHTHTGHQHTSTSTNNTQRPMDLQTNTERHTQLHTQIIHRSPYTKTQVKSTVQTLQAQQLLLGGTPFSSPCPESWAWGLYLGSTYFGSTWSLGDVGGK